MNTMQICFCAYHMFFSLQGLKGYQGLPGVPGRRGLPVGTQLHNTMIVFLFELFRL